MQQTKLRSRLLALSCAVAALSILPVSAFAETVATVRAGATAGVNGTGSMSATAAKAMLGALPASDADVQQKAAADEAYDHAAATGALSAASGGAAVDTGGQAANAPLAVVVSGRSFAGQFDAGSTPPDTTGAVGPTRFVQLVNRRFAIHSRNSTNSLLSSGTLNQLAGWGTGVNSFDPQIIWDPTTARFYYVMDSIVSSTDNRLAFGFSKTASPSTAADWCKYFVGYGAEFPDYPKLGDSRFSYLMGVNVYTSSFVRSDLLAWPKPAAGSTCPAPPQGRVLRDLRDSSGANRIFSPTPANGIDSHNFGYAIARSLGVPSTHLWIKPVETTSLGGLPSFKATRDLVVPSYSVPPSARQPTFTQVLDTSDTRMQQAVFARNPTRPAYSLWTQQTVKNGSFSSIRYYEIDPTFSSPILRRTGLINGSSAFVFNAGISPDRRVDGSTVQFGGSFVVGYTFSSTTLAPRFRAASSVNGGAIGFVGIRNGAAYRDFSCAGAGQRCRWGDYSGATPDPRPGTTGTGAVWLTNQYGGGGTSTAQANWRTWIAAVRP